MDNSDFFTKKAPDSASKNAALNSSVSSILGPAATVRRDENMGRILLELGKISLDQLTSISDLQKREGVPFGEAAIRLGMVTEADIQIALSRQFDVSARLPEQIAYPPALKAAYQPYSAEVEALRGIRSQLIRRWFGTGSKTLALVSINPGDGTSLLAANLAVVFAQTGKQTLLVDANLRTPSQHRIFNLANGDGLADVLSGRAGLNLLTPLAALSDLWLLSAGSPAINPQDLIARAAFGIVNTAVAERFDIVLYDTPAFASAVDALSIAAHAGGALLVVKKDSTGIEDLSAFSEQLQERAIRVVGSVLMNF